MELIRVVLADDQILFVEGLRTVLQSRSQDIAVVGIAHNGREAVDCVRSEQPHIVVMDARMPVMDGVEATRVIRSEFPAVQIIILTTFDDDEYVHEAIKCGAAGYLLKDIPPEELINAIRAIQSGSVLIASSVARRLVERLSELKDRSSASRSVAADELQWFKDLTKREREVLFLLADGWDNRRIAEHLFLAEQTVKNHVSVIYSKLGVHDRIQALQLASRLKQTKERADPG